MLWQLTGLLFLSFTVASCGQIDTSRTATEVKDVITRLLGENNTLQLDVLIDGSISPNGKETFSLLRQVNDTSLHVIGSSGVAAAWGVHHYLKHYCGCHISWDGDQCALPDALPSVNETVTSLDKYKYYQNVCTSSYSFVWWNWARWEREIDWMALNGINLALAFGGQEAIWRRVFDGFGVVNHNFTGPAFLAWNRMGNIRGFGGGLSKAWHARSVELQHLILDRMRILGITPVLPAFSGILPPDFLKVFPTAVGTNISRWNNFPDEYCCPFLLSPNDPLFAVVSRIFLREYIAEFGTDHIYNSDTFNENTPDSNDPGYLADAGRAIFEGIVKEDPLAVWMVQGWMFLDAFWGKEQVKAFVTSVPIGKMLILDLQSDLTPLYDKFDSYYGQPFIWCTLLNFGGQLGLYGHLNKVNEGIVHGRTFENSTMVGLGLTPEGIDQNYIMYDLTLDGSLQKEKRNLTQWVSDYIKRRYGFFDLQVDEAWQILKSTTYNFNLMKFDAKKNVAVPFADHIAKNIVTKLPSLSMNEITWYDKSEVYRAWQLMLSAANSSPSYENSSLFLHDLVDVTRQVAQLSIGNLYRRAVTFYKSGDSAGFKATTTQFLNLLADIDDVLKTDKKFLLGVWLEAAKAAAPSSSEAPLYETNARNQITLWGPRGEIRDYAAKQWSGMMSDFYKPRWNIFFNALQTSLDGGPKYNRSKVNEEIFETVEKPFTFSNKTYPVQPIGQSLKLILMFNNSWPTLAEILSDEYATAMPAVVTTKS